MDEHKDEWGLLVSFTDESQSFVAGFEAGGVWSRMRSGNEAEIELSTHTENREVLQRMACAEGWDIVIEPTAIDGWDTTQLTKRHGRQNNPRGLRIVGDIAGG